MRWVCVCVCVAGMTGITESYLIRCELSPIFPMAAPDLPTYWVHGGRHCRELINTRYQAWLLVGWTTAELLSFMLWH